MFVLHNAQNIPEYYVFKSILSLLKHRKGVCTPSLSFEYMLESLRLRIYYVYFYIIQRNLTRLLSSLLISKVVYTIFINLHNIKKRTEQKLPTVLLYCKIDIRNKKKRFTCLPWGSTRRTLRDWSHFHSASDVIEMEGYSTDVPHCSRNYVLKNRYRAWVELLCFLYFQLHKWSWIV